ncbi:MAG: SAM-dependent methyltransferase [Chitinophagaceae bacterium]|nr:SAM-dependent methyltransferase [Chitinophagaceae bacterium]MBK8951406.1 SAM-dependent methyltransferase [Chitinophagaceae bacterium]
MATVYLIPSALAENSIACIPAYLAEAIATCSVFFAENERTTRRFFKQLWKHYLPGQNMIIDNYEWINMKEDAAAADIFRTHLKKGNIIGIISEAGCPGVADPGQVLIAIAQEMDITVRPLVGPSSILLALMASGMNGQTFQFNGYLPIDNHLRCKSIKDFETESKKKNCTQIFIETPYRNNQLIETLLKTCHPETRLCIAVDITGKDEWIKTKTISSWQKNKPDIHKRPAIFLLYTG